MSINIWKSHIQSTVACLDNSHQGIDNRTVLGSSDVPTSTGNVVRIPRVGGLLNHYERVA
jgi:hypothetical protein